MYQIENPLEHVRKRLSKMREARQPYEEQRTLNQDQTEATSREEEDKFYPNTKLEQAIIEMRLWGRAWDVVIDVEPDQHEPNEKEATIAKHILYKFMHEEKFHKTLRQRRHDKAITWTGVLRCWISHFITCEIQKNDIKIKPQIGNGFYEKKGKKKVYHENRQFLPTNLALSSFFIDENAINQPNFERAVDCIMCEYWTKEEMIHRRGDVPWVDKEALERLENKTENDPERGEVSPDGRVTLYHYFNRLTKDWIIMGNETEIIYKSEYEYECDWLPFVVCQQHPRNNCIYGIGEPEMVSALKAAKNATRQAIIDGVMLSSGKMLLVGNSWELVDSVDSQARVYSGAITMKEVTNSVEQYKEVDTRIDLNPMSVLLDLIDNEVRIATWIDMKAPFEVSEQNLWQTEIKEENKTIRLKSIDELEDFAIGEALTISLNNLIKFAPTLKKSKKEIDVNGNISEVVSDYTIQIPNVRIDKKKGYIEEDLGEYGELEFTDDLVKGKVKVRVITSSTSNNRLTVLEKNKVKELGEIISTAEQIYWPDLVMEQAPFDFFRQKVMSAYGYGDKDTQAKSKKQQTKEKNAKMLQMIKELWQSFTQLSQDAIQPQVQWTPQAVQWAGKEAQTPATVLW